MTKPPLPPSPFTRPPGITRRRALQGLGSLGVIAGLGAGCSDAAPGAPDAGGPPSPDLALPPLTPKELLAGVDTFIVLMMENRSFDHYLGALRSDPTYAARDRVNGLRGDETNPDPTGAPVKVSRAMTFTEDDPPHDWDPCHLQWNNGRNDGFVLAHKGQFQSQVMGYHDRESLPVFYALADQYATCDRWHASVMGPTWPNRFYLHATTSKGKRDNTPFLTGAPTTLWQRMKEAAHTYKNYRAGAVAFYTGGFLGNALGDSSFIAPLSEFFADAAAGKLPRFAMIDPDFLLNDDHPSHDIRLGQALVASIVKALAQSPQWSRSLLVITYDEHGGFFDHVPPPTTVDPEPGFERLGFRVPSFVIGPSVRRGAVVSQLLEHCSVAATLATRFGIQSLGPRMDATADVSAAIDPALVRGGVALPPPVLPQLRVDLPKILAAPRVHSQPQLVALAQAGLLPQAGVSPGPPEADFLSWFRIAESLGVIVNTGGTL